MLLSFCGLECSFSELDRRYGADRTVSRTSSEKRTSASVQYFLSKFLLRHTFKGGIGWLKESSIQTILGILRFQETTIFRTPAGTATWATRCTVSTAPFACAWNTAAAADGLYDVRAVLLDATGKETISATVSNRRVDNSPLRAADIQSTNGSGIAGRVDAGDTLNFSYSQQVNLASVTPGWNGAPVPVTIRLRDGNLLARGSNGDTIDIQRAGSSVNLGSVNTKGNFAKSFSTIYLNGTMSASTVTINEITRSIINVTVGTVSSGSNSLRTHTTPANMVWTPTTAVKNTNGAASSTTPVTETGSLDRDF